MHNVTFLVSFPIFVISAAVFVYALTLLARDDPRARDIMRIGFSIGIFGVVLAAIMFGFFSL